MNPAEVAWYAKPILFGVSASEIWQVLGPLISAFVATIATYYLTRRRDQESFRLRLEEEAKIAARKVRRERLLAAYSALDASEPQRVSFKGVENHVYAELLKERAAALSDINLFGDEDLAKQLEVIIEQGSGYDTSILMNLLRDKLRKEYGLEPTEARYKWVEVTLKETPNEHDGEAKA